MPRLTTSDQSAIQWILLIGSVGFGLALLGQFSYSFADYQGHVAVSLRLGETGVLDNPHILFNFLIVVLAKALPFLGYIHAGFIVSIIVYLFGAVVVYIFVRPAVPGYGRKASLLTLLLTFCLLIVAPISFFTLAQRNLYGGYIAPNALHNPTVILLKPFALLVFALVVPLLRGVRPLGTWTLFVTMLLVILSIFAKPSYLMCLLPVVVVVGAYRLIRREQVEVAILVVGLIIPTIILLLVQYFHAFYVSEFIGETNVIIEPLAGVLPYAPTHGWLVLKFMLSIAFPLAVYGLYYKEALKDNVFNLAVLTFGSATAQMYILAEDGVHAAHGNFWWGAQVTLFILFIIATKFLLRQTVMQRDWRFQICVAVLTLHVICGIIFYFFSLAAVDGSGWF
jgi:hypothetical protein